MKDKQPMPTHTYIASEICAAVLLVTFGAFLKESAYQHDIFGVIVYASAAIFTSATTILGNVARHRCLIYQRRVISMLAIKAGLDKDQLPSLPASDTEN